MRNRFLITAYLLLASLGPAAVCAAQAGGDGGMTLSLAVNEVSLTFHVSDAQGAPLEDLAQADFKLFDNGKPQTRIVEFQSAHDLPIRAGILMDTSISMAGGEGSTVNVVTEYLARYFRALTDQAFVMRFDVETHMAADWSKDPGRLEDGLHAAAHEAGRGADGTAIFDSIYKACRDQWPSGSGLETGNLILLFTDGDDNLSHARIADVIDRCQRSRTAVYAFIDVPKSKGMRGQQTLQQLTGQSGGRIFYQGNQEQIDADLEKMVIDQRSQYRLAYKPLELKRDGSFHRIALLCSTPQSVIQSRSGYYAAARR